MADEADFNSTINVQPNGADTGPQIALISQYVKDLSFENPNAPAVYQWPDQPCGVQDACEHHMCWGLVSRVGVSRVGVARVGVTR